MTSLSRQQKQLLFDYALGLTSESENAEAERLLSSSEEASQVYHVFKAALEPLDSYEVEACPDELADGTVDRLARLAHGGVAQRGQDPLAPFETGSPTILRVPFWRNWGDLAAVAAAVILFVGVLLPTLGFARQKYFQTRCQAQLDGVYEGLVVYADDHDGSLPTVPTTPGAPWWKVGYQGAENHSNTRRAWQLVRQRYVPLERFVCPGRRESRSVPFDSIEIEKYSDFPSRVYIHFSMGLGCPEAPEQALTQKKVILADLNPLSERLPASYAEPLRLRMSRELLSSNSTSHNRRGQNILLCDGSVRFVRQRRTGFSDDDFYSLAEMSDGCEVTGCEVPSCATDAFLVP
ncbi:MAG: hypothetical protein JW993_20685 [Sedimentisphaerales bacterium]|nr:hypothetical protein [Sedimentisphaerales bacterium]